ncbi:helix-turn-helix domain-containing protein [Frankia sp. AgKG'84/4]|uniref:helix-turn-helix domain-containing protein n=1 Tax=Frankia sp. AgKG'84/4 TaxID=573490 RepID=UPI00200CB292|nr:helix-turn-helix transcriptional regulator [Frankia sp. AgKG'84/4]MCL9792737.1 helix-turn-helix transcriptional regulator [Frankia sp. AgKG'84/4]
MRPEGDPAALGELLRSRRGRLTPADVGLPPGERRRTPGLRREEVALLANLSPTYYTFLEQGRQVRPSPQVLDALAAALRLDGAERQYLDVLAHGRPGAHPAPDGRSEPPPEVLAAGVADLVQRLDPHPTFVKGRRWDVLAANAAARELFTDWEARPAADRNLVRWMFTDGHARQVYLDWEHEARAMLGRFRLATASHTHDPSIAALIEELQRDSEHVRRWWPNHDVVSIGASGVKRLRHPRLGPVGYAHVVLSVTDQPAQTLVTYHAQPDSPSPRPTSMPGVN